MTPEISSEIVITPEAFRQHWQGHRGLTRRMIEAFPDDKLLRALGIEPPPFYDRP